MNELENYKYEKEYYLEKTKTLKKLRKQYKALIEQKEELILTKTDTSRIDQRIGQMAQHQFEEEKQLFELFSRKQKVERKIEKLEQPYKNVLYFKYICEYSFEEIAEKMHYSIKRIYQLHKAGGRKI